MKKNRKIISNYKFLEEFLKKFLKESLDDSFIKNHCINLERINGRFSNRIYEDIFERIPERFKKKNNSDECIESLSETPEEFLKKIWEDFLKQWSKICQIMPGASLEATLRICFGIVYGVIGNNFGSDL